MDKASSILMVILPVAVAAVLVTGLLGFAGGGPWYRRHANTLMKLRVGLQLLAVLTLLALVVVS
ncbi:HIG1 domain-containing protein [Magnetospirillum sp. 64-120]|uniref:HIG1 domain-containing protein n=1 Tax=Magnetospirillum sp. 64-120 TaxID=1895778 RepID=UPI0009268FAB|nr:HIG1 domain-containing protein [Magnetospirillum sp. 64-120]OJX81237.1 MAG: hypothetical protein BGO92_09295 [Magnetospirillum sp. 64-120]